MVGFVVRWEMVAVMVIAMVIGASAIWMRALTANAPGGVAQLSGGVASGKHSAKRANGAISFLKVCENDYEIAYHMGRDPPAGDRHLGRMVDAQVKRREAAERSARCLRGCCQAIQRRGGTSDWLLFNRVLTPPVPHLMPPLHWKDGCRPNRLHQQRVRDRTSMDAQIFKLLQYAVSFQDPVSKEESEATVRQNYGGASGHLIKGKSNFFAI
jgi:hypothetical protein